MQSIKRVVSILNNFISFEYRHMQIIVFNQLKLNLKLQTKNEKNVELQLQM